MRDVVALVKGAQPGSDLLGTDLTGGGTAIGARAHPAPSADYDHCKSCGSKVEHHRAPAGDLLCCRICGWSEFVSAEGTESAVVSPQVAPASTPIRPWAA